MMMKSPILLSAAMILCGSVLAQNANVPNIIRSRNTLESLSAGGVQSNTLLYGIPMPQGELRGNVYFDDGWSKASVLLFENDKLLENVVTKYNLLEGQLEIRLQDQTKVLDIWRIKSMVWIDQDQFTHYFINRTQFKNSDKANHVLIEVLEEGKMSLYREVTVKIKDPTYHPALGTGDRDAKAVKSDAFFYSVDEKIFELPKPKEFYSIFGDKAGQIKSFVKENRLSLKKKFDLTRIFQHYNSLT